jgi:hypothetical protein
MPESRGGPVQKQRGAQADTEGSQDRNRDAETEWSQGRFRGEPGRRERGAKAETKSQARNRGEPRA